MTRPESADGVLSRAVRLLECFDARSSELTVTDLSRRAGLPLSTTSRMVAELSRHGLLARSEDGRKVRVGVRLWELGSRAAPTRGLREAALPFMEDLHAVVGHHIQLGVLEGREVLFLERLSAREAVVNVTEVAGRLPLHASSAGLVLLAHAPADVQQTVLSEPLRRFTAATITSPEQLRTTLAEIRRVGHIHTPGHIREAAAGVAVPVRGRGEHVVAALSVVVPNEELAIRTVPALHAAAHGIHRAMS
ncbi:IclR family transcriptional regulator [Nocardioides sp. NPDC006303]|uniref:IclR family transcriptional regulator n=1 Tax=Nocardioides sp. NPDC006303 TaxID=3156747 RepID=UPI00339F3655